MIARVCGKLVHKEVSRAVVDVSGMGYSLFISLTTYYSLPDLNGEVTLHVHTHVREDAFHLFGFLDTGELQLFEQLIKVNKIGPKLALNILSGIPHEELEEAIRRSDVSRLSAIPGVGAKTAERIVVELRGKVGAAVDSPSAQDSGRNDAREDALSALLNLGYQRTAAERAVTQVVRAANEGMGLEDLLKGSLRLLARK